MYNLKKYIPLIVSLVVLGFASVLVFQPAAYSSTPRLGVWVSVFTEEKVLDSKKNVNRLIETCKKCGIDDIYLQVYRSDTAHFDSTLTDNSPYRDLLSRTGMDTLKYLLSEAKQNDLEVHAWINVLSIAQNANANILTKLGTDVLVTDQHGRTPLRKNSKDKLDEYYIRENQLFLDPGNTKVRRYIVNLTEELAQKYPGFAGIHLDYMRYPSAVPSIPDSRFTSHGLSYGYNTASTDNFKKATGLDAGTMDLSPDNSLLWDNWRRDQVTALVRDVSGRLHAMFPDLKISCAVGPSAETSYLMTFQDWTEWLRKDYVDYIVAMNYTKDLNLLKIRSASLLVPEFSQKVHIGVGPFLMKDHPEMFMEQFKTLRQFSPAGIVIFSYDEISGDKEIQRFLSSAH
ncbi:MAG: family 10 glycosylhydrolase [Candidatus Omnitrophota bacterium]